MPIVSTQVTVATTATSLATGRENRDPITVVLKSPSATIYLGGSDVSSTNGLPLTSTDSFSIDLMAGDSLFAIAVGSSATVQMLRSRS